MPGSEGIPTCHKARMSLGDMLTLDKYVTAPLDFKMTLGQKMHCPASSLTDESLHASTVWLSSLPSVGNA